MSDERLQYPFDNWPFPRRLLRHVSIVSATSVETRPIQSTRSRQSKPQIRINTRLSNLDHLPGRLDTLEVSPVVTYSSNFAASAGSSGARGPRLPAGPDRQTAAPRTVLG